MKANPNYGKEREYYLVKDAQVWHCLFKSRAENKAHRMMDQYVTDQYIQEPSAAPMGSGGRGSGREKSRHRSNGEHKDRNGGEPSSTVSYGEVV